jgi:hypothetical protein
MQLWESFPIKQTYYQKNCLNSNNYKILFKRQFRHEELFQ